MNKGIRVLAIAYLLTFISFASKAEVKAGSCSAKDVQLLDGYAKFLQEKINTTLKAKNPIQVTRKDGRFILTGTVDGQNDKSQIDKICADFTPSMDATVCQSQIRILVDEDGKKKRTGHEAYEGSPFLPDGSVNPVFVPPGYQ